MDTNDDGEANIADAVFLLNFLFGPGPIPGDPFPGCGIDSTPDVLTCLGPTMCAATTNSTHLVYSKHRDHFVFVDGDPAPILSGDGSGFDSGEVDGPAIAVDKSRPNGDFFLLFFEAKDAIGQTSIGVLSSDEEDFVSPSAIAIPRQQVVSPSNGAAIGAFDVAATDPTLVVDKRSTTPPPSRYKMWFEGRTGAGGAISTIVYCDSGDAISWANFQVCTGLTPGVQVSFGDRVADPTVVLDRSPSGDLFKLWFEAVDEGGNGHASIGYADSVNGVDWIVRDAAGSTGAAAGPVIVPGFGGPFSEYTVRSPSVVLVEDFADNNVNFHIWYTGGDVSTALGTEDAIGWATSPNGTTWFAESTPSPDFLPVLRPTGDGNLDPVTGSFEWDSGDVRQPCAWIDDSVPPSVEGAFLLWYAGDIENGGPNSANHIGFAKGRAP